MGAGGKGADRRSSILEQLSTRFSLSNGLARMSLGLSDALGRLGLGGRDAIADVPSTQPQVRGATEISGLAKSSNPNKTPYTLCGTLSNIGVLAWLGLGGRDAAADAPSAQPRVLNTYIFVAVLPYCSQQVQACM